MSFLPVMPFGIEPVSTLSGVTGAHVGQIKLLTTTDTLYVWTGSAWSTDLFTASNVDPGSITAASFASGVEPISAVSSLPSPTGYTGPTLIFLTTDKKLYRYNSAVPEFTAAIATTDLTGTIEADNFAADLRPVEIVSSLPTTGLTEGRVVILTTDNDKMYRYTGSEWTKAISAADMDDQIQASQIATDAVTAGAIQAGAISTSKLDANAITAAKVNVSELFADEAVIGAIQTSAITTSAIVSTIGDFEFIEAENIVAGTITGSKLDVDTIEANKIKLDNITLSSDGDNLVIKSGGVNTTQLADDAVTNAKIDDNAVDADKIADGSIAGTKFASGLKPIQVVSSLPSVASSGDQAYLTTDEKLYRYTGVSWTSEIDADDIPENSLKANRIVANSLTAGQIQAGAIGVDELDADAVTAEKLQQTQLPLTPSMSIISPPFQQIWGR